MSIEVSPRSRMRVLAGDLPQSSARDANRHTRAGDQLTKQVGLILTRETTSKVDCVRKVRHGYEIEDEPARFWKALGIVRISWSGANGTKMKAGSKRAKGHA